MIEALDIHVTGLVQGVGFRPFVYRMAKNYLINGWVLNAADGVNIHAEGESRLLDEFVIELSENAPAAAQVKEIELKEVPLQDFDSFEIRFSDDAAVRETTLVSADLATCDDCAAELFNPNDRRFRYPFINCTNCGPRFTIIDALPYDRASTSMKDFPMCKRCAAEYADPLDRRFHAQPDACFECGPHLSLAWRPDCEATPGEDFPTRGAGDVSSDELPDGWRIAWGKTRETSDALIARAVELLCAGQVVAVKGLGGFHLVCDARNASAFAIMTANGLPPRRFPSRSRAIASALRASHTIWNPPSPFTATTCPAHSSSTARAMRASEVSRVFPQAMRQPSGSSSESKPPAPRVGKSTPGVASQSGRHAKERCGPHSKHASGCAWKRRSSGSAYSAAQRSHMGKSFIDVLARS